MLCLCVLLSQHPWLLSQECQCMAAMVKQTGRQNGIKWVLNSVAWICLTGTNPETPAGLSLDKGNTPLVPTSANPSTVPPSSRLFPEPLAEGSRVSAAKGAGEAACLGTLVVRGQWQGSGSVCRAGSCLAAPSAVRAIENVQQRRQRFQPCPRGWKQALFVCQPDAGASGYIPALLLVPVWALTKAFWDVSQQLLQQCPGPGCPCAPLHPRSTGGMVLGTCRKLRDPEINEKSGERRHRFDQYD